MRSRRRAMRAVTLGVVGRAGGECRRAAAFSARPMEHGHEANGMIRSKNDESAAVTQDNGFAIARRQFDRIADRLRLDSATRD